MKALRRKRGRSQADIEQSISAVLTEAQALLRIAHYTLDIAEFSGTTGVLSVRIEGSCPECNISPTAFIRAIDAHIRMRVSEVREVNLIGMAEQPAARS